MIDRRAITDKMKWQCLIVRGNITCAVCNLLILLTDKIEWDHVHEVADQGPHEFWNIRPLHEDCHQRKTTSACKQRAHVKRLAAGPKKSRHPMRSGKREWPKRAFGT